MTPLQRAFLLEVRRGLANYHSHRSGHNRRFGFRPGLSKGCLKCERTAYRVLRNAITAESLFGPPRIYGYPPEILAAIPAQRRKMRPYVTAEGRWMYE